MMFSKILIYIMIWLLAINSVFAMFNEDRTTEKIGLVSFCFDILAGLLFVIYGSIL